MIKKMKEYNDYNDKLVSKAVAMLAWSKGYEIYGPECFVKYEDDSIKDEWSGLIPEGGTLVCYRPTQNSLHKWLMDNHNIYVGVDYDHKGFAFYYLTDLKNPGDDTNWSKNFKMYEEAFESGLIRGLEEIK